MRWGMPSTRMRDLDLLGVAHLQVALERGRRHATVAGHQEARAHGDALGTVGERREQAAAVVEAAGGDHRHRTASTTCGSSTVVGTLPVWPPPSPPWMVMTLAPISIAFERVLERAHGGHANDAGVAQPPDHLLVRPAAVAHGADAVLDRQVEQLLRVGLEHVEVEAERLVAGQRLHTQDLGLDAVGGDRGAGQEPEAAGVGRGGDQVRAGHPAHRRLHDGVAAAEQVAKRRAQGHLGGQVFFSASSPAACDLLPATMLRASCPPSVPAPSSWL
jgi:hypothetical protein